MTGINTLALLFGSSNRVAETDGTSGTSSAGSTVQSSPTASNFSLLDSDKSVVSTAGGAMVDAMNTSDVRTDKVAALKAAIDNGTYNVSSQAVAQKLITSMLDKW